MKRKEPEGGNRGREEVEEGSSRIRIIGLPVGVDQKRLKEHFGGCGEVTDCAIIRNPKNNRPRMAFLGFKSEEHAAKAVRSLNNSYYNTSKMSVEFAKQIGDSSAERNAWSRHTKRKIEVRDKEEKQKKEAIAAIQKAEEEARVKAEKSKKDKIDEKKDRNFRNFLEATKGTANRKIWENDMEDAGEMRMQVDDDDDAASVASAASLDSNQERERQEKLNTMSDLDFFKSKQKPLSEQQEDAPQGGTTSTLTTRSSPSATPAPAKKRPVRGNTVFIKSIQRPTAVPTKFEVEDTGPSKEEVLAEVMESGRLYLRNVAFTASEDEIKELCERYGVVAEAHIPLTKDSHQSKGVAFVQFAIPEQAAAAYESLAGRIFQGRVLSVDSATSNPYEKEEESHEKSSYKKQKEMKEKAEQANPNRWNSLFMSGDAVAAALSKRMNVDKGSLLEKDTQDVATRLAMGEAHLTTEVREIFGDEGLDLGVLADANRTRKRSDRVLLVKNLPKDTNVQDLTALFSGFGALDRVVAPKETTIALISFVTGQEAKVAFRKLACRPFNRVPLFLEWAPVGALKDVEEPKKEKKKDVAPAPTAPSAPAPQATQAAPAAQDDIFEDSQTLYITNIAFSIKQDDFERFVKSCLPQDVSHIVTMKLPPNKGYGFVQMKTTSAAKRAYTALSGKTLMQRQLNVEYAKQDKMESAAAAEGCPEGHDPLKLTVKNVPFEAKREDVAKLFEAFSQVKSVRLPRKTAGERGAGGAKRPHRGFAFVEFTTPQECVAARKKLSNTHLYGRHLVIEHAKLDDTVGSSVLQQKQA